MCYSGNSRPRSLALFVSRVCRDSARRVTPLYRRLRFLGSSSSWTSRLERRVSLNGSSTKRSLQLYIRRVLVRYQTGHCCTLTMGRIQLQFRERHGYMTRSRRNIKDNGDIVHALTSSRGLGYYLTVTRCDHISLGLVKRLFLGNCGGILEPVVRTTPVPRWVSIK